MDAIGERRRKHYYRSYQRFDHRNFEVSCLHFHCFDLTTKSIFHSINAQVKALVAEGEAELVLSECVGSG